MDFINVSFVPVLLSVSLCFSTDTFADVSIDYEQPYIVHQNTVSKNTVPQTISPPSTSSQERVQQDIPPQNKDCITCHSTDLQIHKTIKNTDKCDQCHSSTIVEKSLQRASQQSFMQQTMQQKKSQQTVSQQGSPQLFPQHKTAMSQKEIEKINAGMRYPMYYIQSRLGGEPNEMILIPAGEFIMGSNDRLPDEGPQHKVTLPEYYIDKYEVTNLQYKKFIDKTQRRSPKYFRNRTFPDGRADHPVTYVGWDDANEYCQWAGKRLATEQEWEKASRGTDARVYPWGNEFELTYANTPGRWKEFAVFGDTTPVGSFEKGVSPYGAYDMSGNVWEWTASWYKPHPGNKMSSENYGERYKILKGGSWWDCSFYKCGLSAPVYNRSFFAKKVKNDTFGFRCAKNARLKE